MKEYKQKGIYLNDEDRVAKKLFGKAYPFLNKNQRFKVIAEINKERLGG